MKDKWLKDLHDRMPDFEMDVPEGLWDDIEKAEKVRASAPVRARAVWAKRITAAAAVAAIAVLGVDDALTPFPEVCAVSDLVCEYDVALNDEPATAKTESPAVPSVKTMPRGTEMQSIAANMDPEAMPEMEEEDAQALANSPSEQAEASAAEVNTVVDEKPHAAESIEDQLHTDRLRHALSSNSRVSNSRHDLSGFSAGLYSAGLFSSNPNNGNSYGGMQSSGVMCDDYSVLGVFASEQIREVHTVFHHHQPVRVGVSVAYRLTGRVSVSSGITYTTLKSDFSSDSNYSSGEQTLRYVGVPLNVSCDIVSWKRLTLYGTAGVLAEKCVYGKTTNDSAFGNSYAPGNTSDIGAKPFQWSVNAAAGLRLGLTNSLGIYAEPGVSYYFNDGTEIKTIYKDRPVNFNLNLGIRLEIR